MIGPLPIVDADQNRRSQYLSAQYRLIANEVGVPYLDVFSKLENSKTWMREVALVDGAHPQAGGYEELAGLVASWSVWWFHTA